MKYQLTCPKCKHEFAYDNGAIDAKIASLTAEQQSLQRQLTEHKLLPKDEQFRRTAWWKRTKARFAQVVWTKAIMSTELVRCVDITSTMLFAACYHTTTAPTAVQRWTEGMTNE